MVQFSAPPSPRPALSPASGKILRELGVHFSDTRLTQLRQLQNDAGGEARGATHDPLTLLLKLAKPCLLHTW